MTYLLAGILLSSIFLAFNNLDLDCYIPNVFALINIFADHYTASVGFSRVGFLIKGTNYVPPGNYFK